MVDNRPAHFEWREPKRARGDGGFVRLADVLAECIRWSEGVPRGDKNVGQKQEERTMAKERNTVRKEAVHDGDMVVLIELDRCIPCPDNEPVDEKEERFLSICRTVKAGGVQLPILVRPHPTEPDKYEIRDGERRWRAAKAAGLKALRAIVRPLTDAEAAAATEILNTDRRELPPLRQGVLVAQVLAAHGGDVKAAAAVLGQSPYWVATRAQLGALSEDWKAEMVKPDSRYAQWTIAHWIQIARLPAEAQRKAFSEIQKQYGNAPKTTQELEEFLGGMQQLLKGAPWALDDGLLNRKAGSCATCSKRTEALGQLFYEKLDPKAVQADDRCLDAGCWKRKLKAHVEARIAAALEKHPEAVKVSTDNSGKGALKYYEFTYAKKGDKGAQLAVIVSPNRAGETTYVKVKPQASQHREQEVAREQTPKEQLAVLREGLSRRRNQEMDALIGQTIRGKRFKQPKKAETIIRLAAAFGSIPTCDDNRKMLKAGMPQVYAALWHGIINAVGSYDAGPLDALIEAGGVKMAELRAEVEKAVPEPKEIAELEAQVKAGKTGSCKDAKAQSTPPQNAKFEVKMEDGAPVRVEITGAPNSIVVTAFVPCGKSPTQTWMPDERFSNQKTLLDYARMCAVAAYKEWCQRKKAK